MKNVFRTEYRALAPGEKETIADLKGKADVLWNAIDESHGDPRMNALAKTNLEQAVMWATKALTG